MLYRLDVFYLLLSVTIVATLIVKRGNANIYSMVKKKTMKKRVLFVVQGAAGGVSRYLIDIISNMDSDKYQVGVVYNSQFEDERFRNWRILSNNIQFFNLKTLVREISLENDISACMTIVKIINNFKPNVVHAQSSKAGLIARIAARIKHVHRIVYTPHAYAFLSPEFSKGKRFLYRMAERFLSRYFTDITINCSYSEHYQAIKARIDRCSKLKVIPNAVPAIHGLNRSVERARLGVKSDRIIVGTLARVSPQKNPELFEKIASAVSKLNSDILFVWIGTNSQERKSRDVIFKGEMSQSQELLAGIDLYLSTSLFEGLSYSLLEAASVGIPVLASNVPGNDDFISKYNYGFSFELDDPIPKISQQIISLLQNPRLKKLQPEVQGFSSMIEETLSTYN